MPLRAPHPTPPRDDSSVAPGALTALLADLARAPAEQSATAALQPGDFIGRFRVVREVGRGGFGVLYEAHDEALGRRVALKLLNGRRPAPDDASLLAAEAEAAAQLQHPNIVSLFDGGVDGGVPYLVMELLQGETLEERLRRGPLASADALRIATDVAGALAHAHARGVVHRDLKPANVFVLPDGTVKLLDFGLARFIGAVASSGGGTPGYMAPEQRRRDREDERVDVHALGLLLFEMITGERANGTTGPLTPPEVALALRRAGTSAALVSIVVASIAHDPAERPRDGSALLVALSQEKRRRDRRRSYWRAGALAAAAVALVGATWTLRSSPKRVVVVALADVVNETGEQALDGVAGLLVASLEHAGDVRVISRTRMVDALRLDGRGDVERLDPAAARHAAAQTAAGALLVATIRRFDETYTLEVEGIAPANGDRLFAATAQARGRGNIPHAIIEVSQRVTDVAGARARRHATMPPVGASLEAYSHYFRGQQLADQHRSDEAIEEYRRAVAVEPTFALAHYQIAHVGAHGGVTAEEQRSALRAAVHRREQLPARERELVDALEAAHGGRLDEAIARYRRLAEAFPEDKDPPYLIADLLFHGREEMPAGSLEEARKWFERTVELDPGWPVPLTHLVQLLASNGDGRAAQLARRAVALSPSPGNYVALAEALAGAGEREEALRAFSTAVELSGSQALTRAYRIPFLVYAERLDEAESEARAIAGQVPFAEWTPVHEASLLAYQGRRAEGRRVLFSSRAAEAFKTAFDDPGTGIAARRAVYAAGDGDRREVVRQAARFLEVGGGDATEVSQIALALAEVNELAEAERFAALYAERQGRPLRLVPALILARRGDVAGAIARLRSITAAAADLDTKLEQMQSLYYLGVLCAEAGLDREAVDALDRFQRPKLVGVVMHTWAHPRSLVVEARVRLRLGERDEALASVDRALQMWAGADRELPLLAEAHALRERASAR